LNPVFEILPEIHEAGLTRLFCEVSEQSFSYFFKNEKNNLITGLSVFHFNKINNDNGSSGILKKILQEQDLFNNNKEVFISYAYSECMVVPAPYHEPEKNQANLSILHGDLEPGIILSDFVPEKNLYTVYRIPLPVYDIITKRFPGATNTHQYSSLIKTMGARENLLRMIFYQQKIVMMLIINGDLQIIQSYNYKTPDDVVYHILNICAQFHVEEALLQLHGMIEEDSALFREIHKYFLSMKLGCLPDTCNYAEGIKEFPSHYFSHLFSLAPCG
jgi:Protein of unknown function (DUF3822)